MSKFKYLPYLLFLFILSFPVLQGGLLAQDATEDYQNTLIEPQTGIFVAQFNAMSTADSVDGVLGFSKIEPAGYGDYSCKVLFNNEGFITANNGGSFEADSAFAYAAGQVYAVKVIINIPAQTFSAWVTPEGGDAVTIGKDFAFSPKAGVVDSINYRSIKMSFGKWGGNEGIVQVSDFQITPVIEGGQTCAFIGSKPYPGADADLLLIAHLEENYDLTIVDDDSVMDGAFTIYDLRDFDFAFVSESASTWRLSSAPDNIYKLAPVPMFYTECYASKPSVAGWVSAEGFFGTINDSTGEGRKVIIVDEEDNPLAAGFANGAEVEIVSGTNDTTSLGTLTYSVPEIDYIPIAVWIGDPDLSVVFGVEAGTPLWDDLGLTVDPNFVSENRAAAVGVFAPANDFITEDGYKLIDAGINWVLGMETAVEERVMTAPVAFELSQNYPNPFNPTTEISFSLAARGYATLTVYNVIGQKIATLVNEELDAGLHHLTFKADNIPSGVYFYQLQTDESSQIKKMMLMK